MASFNGNLHLNGQLFPVTQCSYEFTQSADTRGRAAAKVRSGLITLSLVVPEGEELISWAADPHKKLSGVLAFSGIDQPMAHEELTFEQGICVSYEEVFEPNELSDDDSAYYCVIQIAAGQLTMGMSAKDSNWALTR
ncbi:type VI secretion system tube protein TssD [Hymenobacter cellulosilyticus]|uniref:Type VI secretion system needle protein Hcp n=1 Tax=Hymenobacter cellulosilyticus TaxID=2932248 RepID=A0A8T9QEG3_9BACT|nr:type VI secretion system tube protein TssD [Hymenobacter cellulosilyticus]UOQ74811.1 hypothetical protein MUN79_13630 [Hymenobacter cellulosilyticus]